VKKKSINIIEFSQNWYNEEDNLLVLSLNEKNQIFKGKNFFNEFIQEMPKGRVARFYTIDPTPLFIKGLK
jgi:hypothetical protein